MRTLFTIVALVLALAVVGLLARQQPTAPGVAPGAHMGYATPPVQPSRALADDTK